MNLSKMPYDKRSELPKQVKDNLPAGAQSIFRKAYNNAWDEYKHPDKRKGDDSREEVANKVAWSAVKKKYEKQDGEWKKKIL